MTGEIIVRLNDFSAGFRLPGRIRHVFRGADMEIRQGDLACLVGPSGSGKSVLLNLLIGSLRPGRGGLVLDGGLEVMGKEITKKYPRLITGRMGTVFQEGALFDDLSVMENAVFGLKRHGFNPLQAAEKARAVLAEVGLENPPSRVHELSGGQKKRLALARSLAVEPEFLIFDEPTSGLDPLLCRQIAELILKTHRAGRGKRTTLIVTHDYEAVLPNATRSFLINPGAGKIEEIGKGEDPESRLKSFIDVPATGGAKEEGAGRLVYLLKKALETPVAWLSPVARFLSNPVPAGRRQISLRFADALIHPALYVCAAGAVLGGLATFFALENNPLKGAMDRQAIIGLGKVLTAIVIPLMTAVLFAARVGAGAAARLGNIRLGRKDEALRMLGADPGRYLVTPLFWSCLTGLPLLNLPVCAAACLASLFFACGTRPITPFGWASSFFCEVLVIDILFVFIKLIGSGCLVAAAAVFFGTKDKSGAEALGRDVTSTIVAATFLVILWHGVLTFLQYR